MPTPTITNISTTIGPIGQWVYIQGTNFSQSRTEVFFGNDGTGGSRCERVTVYNANLLGTYVPDPLDLTGYFTVYDNVDQYDSTGTQLYSVAWPDPVGNLSVTRVKRYYNEGGPELDGFYYVFGTGFCGHQPGVPASGCQVNYRYTNTGACVGDSWSLVNSDYPVVFSPNQFIFRTTDPEHSVYELQLTSIGDGRSETYNWYDSTVSGSYYCNEPGVPN
jgi:hypothetical protein